MTDFDLSKLAREVHDTTDLTDHDQIAKEIRHRISDADIEEALHQALVVFATQRFTQYRTSVSYPKPSSKSAKRDGIRDWWHKQLNQRYATSEGQKLLREFTTADCLYQAAMDQQKAAELMAKAQSWQTLAELLHQQKVKTVGDLA